MENHGCQPLERSPPICQPMEISIFLSCAQDIRPPLFHTYLRTFQHLGVAEGFFVFSFAALLWHVKVHMTRNFLLAYSKELSK